jgi:hypothetical protein
MNPNPSPDARWTTPVSPASDTANTCASGAIAAARRSCLDLSPRKWLRMPIAPKVLAVSLHELFWGTPDADFMSESRARIERLIDQAMEQSQLFNTNNAGPTP